MIKKQLYTFNSTINKNTLINYSRFLSNNQRNEIYNKERDDNLTYIHLQTENYDKYYNTRYIGMYVFKTIESLTPFLCDADDFDDEDYYDED